MCNLIENESVAAFEMFNLRFSYLSACFVREILM